MGVAFCLPAILALLALFAVCCLAFQVVSTALGVVARWPVAAAVIFGVGFALIMATHSRAAPPPQLGPLGVPPTAREVALGQMLFFDPRLSVDGTISCASCHDPKKGWGDGLELAVGINGLTGTRNSPTIINASYSTLKFWDGRAVGDMTQALLPLSNPLEMGRQTEADVVARLRLIPGYVQEFAATFGIDPATQSPITGPRLARAIAAFESTIISFDAPIDRYLDGDAAALTPTEVIGFELVKQARCLECHTPPLFTDNVLHNNGMEFASRAGGQRYDQGQAGTLAANRRTPPTIRAFKTPTLREVSSTAPYNHAGSFADLDRVILHYASGGRRFDGTIDPNIDPRVVAIGTLGWTEAQRGYVKAWLQRPLRGRTLPTITETRRP
jgi:cytochrome c peroxidase